MIHINARGTHNMKQSDCGRSGTVVDAGVFVQEMGNRRKDLCPDCAEEIFKFVSTLRSMIKPEEVRCVERYFKRKIL
jgi:hypothetical protein